MALFNDAFEIRTRRRFSDILRHTFFPEETHRMSHHLQAMQRTKLASLTLVLATLSVAPWAVAQASPATPPRRVVIRERASG